MKLSNGLGLAGLGVFVVGAAIATGGVIANTGCSSSSAGSSSGGSGGDTCGPGVSCTVQPAVPANPSAPSGKTHNYAMRTLYLGDTDRSGVTKSSAWQGYGYNLDNLVTQKSSTDVCTLAAGASKSTQVDGTGGVDNSFGENILPIVITTAGANAAANINQSITGGSFTVMMDVTGFDDTANSTANATGLTGVLLAGGSYPAANDGGAPTWDLNTHWPVRPELVNGCNGTTGCPAGTDPVANAKVKFPQAYQANGTFVNGSPGDLDLSLSIGGQSLDINVHSALVTFTPKGPGSVTNGVIAGTIVTEELITSLKSVAGHISTSLCSGSAFDSIAAQITQASDIIIDSATGAVSNVAGQNCNGISIGLGFDATEIAPPVAADVAGPTPPAKDPCADAGTD